MDLSKLERNITMNCPTCAGTQFKFDETIEEHSQILECVACGKQLSRIELRQENSENIDQHVKEIGKLAAKEITKELAKAFKNIKLKI